MKKLLIALMICLIWPAMVLAEPSVGSQSISSGVSTTVTSTGIVYNGPCWLTGMTLITDGTNDSGLVALDSGVTKAYMVTDATTMTANRWDFSHPVRIENNLRMWVYGTNASAILEYIPDYNKP